MRFVAIDVETANSDPASICQIGIAVFENEELVETWKSYIDPKSHFSSMNISIHGITAAMVAGAPTICEVYPTLRHYLDGVPTVQHSTFDRSAINGACCKQSLETIEARWLDSVRVARRAWPEQKPIGYGLKKMATLLDIGFMHHDALEDATAAGWIVVHAIRKTGISIEDWFARVDQPVIPKKSRKLERIHG